MRRVAFEIFKSSVDSWEKLFGRAAEFAGEIGRDRLITISHSHESVQGVVVVWYWETSA